MSTLKNRFIGAGLAILSTLLMYGVNTFVNFRNDYLRIHAEHTAMYGFLAGVVAKDEKGTNLTRAQILDLYVNQSLQKAKE